MNRRNNNPKPLFSRWHVKVVIFVLASFVIYLTVKSFMTGYREGIEMRKAMGE